MFLHHGFTEVLQSHSLKKKIICTFSYHKIATSLHIKTFSDAGCPKKIPKSSATVVSYWGYFETHC